MKTVCTALLFMLLITALGFSHFYQRYQVEKNAASRTATRLAAQQNVINVMRQRQQSLAALDAHHLQELNDAQSKIKSLQHDVAAGNKRLRLAATCRPLSAATASPRVDDADRARLTDAAERDYFSLRNRIAFTTKQLAGLQDYIRQQCLRSTEPFITTETVDE